MQKEFNVTGVCIPKRHYMADTSKKMAQVMAMVEAGKYFTINRPRQYGKTTTLSWLNIHLQKSADYLVFKISFEGIGVAVHRDEKKFCQMFINQLTRFARFVQPDWVSWLKDLAQQVYNLNDLSDAITSICEKADKKVVLLIDEVDSSSDFQLFLNFLGMLRTKYLNALEDLDLTFHSVILVGVYDIKTLKHKIRSDEKTTLNSPWNIAADFKVDMNLQPAEIEPMLAEYAADNQVKIDIPLIAKKLFYYTSGYPFLVSKLCKNIAEIILEQKKENGENSQEWTLRDLEQSVDILLKSETTNFESLIKNLENNKGLYDFVYRVIVNGEVLAFNRHNPLIHLGLQYGIFKEKNKLAIHNRIYEQVIYNYMTSKTEAKIFTNGFNFRNQFLLHNNALDIKKILTNFQRFMKEEFSEKDQTFLERQGRLIFLAFLKPIINGSGYDFKEVQISMEKRLDVVVTYFQHKYIIELKRWYGEKYHQEGLDQLSDYLDRQHLDEGYLIIYEHRTEKTWRQEVIEHQGKRIFAVWV